MMLFVRDADMLQFTISKHCVCVAPGIGKKEEMRLVLFNVKI